MRIDVCEPPHDLAVTMVDETGPWRLEARVRKVDGGAELELVHHLPPDADARDTGPGWEYYLDRLVASMVGGPMPHFDDYYPAQRSHYEAAAHRSARQSGSAAEGQQPAANR